MKKFNNIYIEITNDCNLNCSFCIHNNRDIEYLSFEHFKFIIDKIKDYTEGIYLHILGEPLMHKDINEFIDYASKYMMVRITTNGVYIEKIKNNKNIRQLNISLHSSNGNAKYLNNIFDSVDILSKNTLVIYRLWTGENKTIKDALLKRYNKCSKGKLSNNIYLDIKDAFVWPNLNNNLFEEYGKCYGLITHIGILVDGTIVPCCLDSKGVIKLGNIYKDNLNDILNTTRVKDMINGFKNNKKCELLCKHCKFL